MTLGPAFLRGPVPVSAKAAFEHYFVKSRAECGIHAGEFFAVVLVLGLRVVVSEGGVPGKILAEVRRGM